ncbi:hypothetical protein CL689_04360 [Candidatus Saccharibacteria bacterium]|nr:hypothetical protein [Candidatus Saccharibacteria bacterium]MBJ58407.1 hypothetical protein [Candidatus Saccharibacteria bacterium]MBQ69277.1 hypothetical protein [Candidatus Saccharibacteria bacterium]|tara:strand:- start:43 stop:558 length:516 start_codon:yes stop_codon:yes gene_type:complete
MKKSASGFTIVELLIVIVVIAILAAITIVAYNGIQNNAKNTKTIAATNAWIKGIRLYEAKTGALPSYNSCFGTSSTYSGNGQCWNGSTWVVNNSFLTAMSEYMGSFPEPDTTQMDPANYPDRRGSFYQISGGSSFVWMSLIGVSTCPGLGGVTFSSQGTGSNGIYCRYIFQ